jgi:hypothetical protein
MRFERIPIILREQRTFQAPLPVKKPRFSTRERVVLALVFVQSFFLYGDPGVTVPGVISAVLLALVLLGWLIDRRSILPGTRKIQSGLVYFLGLTGLGICIGYVRGNEPLDIAKDFMKFGNLFIILYFLKGSLETPKVLRIVEWIAAIVYVPTLVAFLGKVGVSMPYFIAAVDYGNQCLPIVLIVVAGVLFNFLRMRTLLVLILFPPLFTLIVSGTRSYWLGTISGVCVLYFLRVKSSSTRQSSSKRDILLLMGLLAGCIYVGVVGLPFGGATKQEVSEERGLEQRLQFLQEGKVAEEQSVDARLDETSRVLKSIKNWVLGNGLGEKVIVDSKEGFGMWDFTTETWFHNAYLFFLLKMGLIGFVVFLTLVFFLFRFGYQTFRMTAGFEKALSAFFIAYLTSASIMSLSTGNFLSPRCWLVLGICGGVLVNVRGRLQLLRRT